MTIRSNPHWAANLASNLQQRIPEVMAEAMETQVESEAKRLVYLGHPDHLERKTGRLQDSISTQVSRSDMSATVGTNVVYAPVHEFGAVITDRNGTIRFIPPRPFLVPAFEAKKDAVLADFKRGFHEIVQESSVE